MSGADGGLNGRIVSRLVQMRRGGEARIAAIGWFETAVRSDGRPAFGWWVDYMVNQYDGVEWDPSELREVARRGMIKALDSYAHTPGTQIASVLARLIRICVANALRDHVRSNKGGKAHVVPLDEARGAADGNAEERMITQAMVGQLRAALGDQAVDDYLSGAMAKKQIDDFLERARSVLLGDEADQDLGNGGEPSRGDDRERKHVQRCLFV